MSPEFTYLLKVNTGIMIFYLFYRMFFSEDTFFRMRRVILLGFFIISLLYPLLNIEGWVKSQEPILEIAQLYASAILPEIGTGIQDAGNSRWWQSIPTIFFSLYIIGVIVLSVRLLLQLSGIMLLNRHCRKERIREIRVRILEKDGGPFSFFKWIFIYPFKHNREEIEEILLHEQTHADQWHSIDVIVSELVTIFFWFNPFAWLMKREIRNNLEYLADKRVIESGFDSKKYQYHLLELTQKQDTAPLYNSFKVLPLKNRIRMMNKKRTHSLLRTKYLAVMPLIMLLLIISNIETIARSTVSLAKDVIQMVEEHPGNNPEPEVITDEMPEMEIITSPVTEPTPTSTPVVPEPAKEELFMVVEQMPEYPGGMQALMSYLASSIIYPRQAAEAGTQGRVIVQFVVERDGSITEPVIAKGVDPLLDQEAIRIVSEMSHWNPGKQRGRNVRVKFTLPIQFRLIAEPEPEVSDPTEEEIPETAAFNETDFL